jgi:hypothetical protein
MKGIIISILIALSITVTIVPAEEAHADGMERVSRQP